MNKNLVRLTIVGVFLLLFACKPQQAEKKVLTGEPQTEPEKISYVLGLDIGNHLKGLQTDIDLDVFLQGVETSLEGKDPLITPEQATNIKKEFSQKMMQERAEKNKKMAVTNKEEGEKFLAENKTKEGVKTTESGLQYIVLEEGKGETPKATDTVSVQYKGTLINGTEFDSSYKRGKPATFPLNRVIPGWTEGLQLMREGAKYRFFIPSDLAYGERGTGPVIGPNATLIFDVELLSIEKATSNEKPEK